MAPARTLGKPRRPRAPVRPRPRQPDLYHLQPEHLWRRLRVRGIEEELEKLHGFRPGGYYPLHLQDELHDGQYRIIHKLGYGGFATVWLCRNQRADIPTYVAIKVFVASEEVDKNADLILAAKLEKNGGSVKNAGGQHLCFPREHFITQSPNGKHLCFVFPVLGPTVGHVKELFGSSGESLSRNVQEISRQMVEALDVLHKNGVCHGDFRPSNVLLSLQSLDGVEEDEVLERLEEPQTADIIIHTDPPPFPSEIPYAPKYLVYSVDFRSVDVEFVSPYAHVIDFGQSFDASCPPVDYGIPLNYSAPEVFFDKRGSIAMDMWSLACTVYEMRLGRRLFDVFQLVSAHPSHYVDEIASVLGKPPEPWAEHYEPEGESDTDDESGTDEEYDTDEECDTDDESDTDEPQDRPYQQEDRTRSIYDRLGGCHECYAQDCDHPRFRLISEAEAADLADLLGKLLRYNAEERLSAQEALKHPWFNTRY